MSSATAANVSLFSLASSSVPKSTSVASPRFSRISFTPSSIHSEGRSWRLEATAGDEKKSFLEEKISEAQKGASDINESAKANFKTIQDKTEEAAGVVSDKSKEASSVQAEKEDELKKAAEGALEDAQNKAEKVKEAVFGKDGEK